jgi:hypothetical protein
VTSAAPTLVDVDRRVGRRPCLTMARPRLAAAPRIPAVGPRVTILDRVAVTMPLDPLFSLKALSIYSSLSPRTLRTFVDLPPDEALPGYRVPATGGSTPGRTIDAWLRVAGEKSVCRLCGGRGRPLGYQMVVHHPGVSR